MKSRRAWLALPVLALVAIACLLWPRAHEIEVHAGSAPEAIPLLEHELHVTPGNARVRSELGKAYELVGRPGQALALIEQEAKRRPLTPEERDRAERLALALGTPARALSLLTGPQQPADAIDPPAGLRLALQAHDLSAARRFRERFLALHPTDEAALTSLRDLARSKQDWVAAIALQERLTDLSPMPARVDQLVSLHLAADDPRGALVELERYPTASDIPAWHRRAVQLAARANLPAAAVPHLRALDLFEPSYANGRSLLEALVAARDVGAMTFARELAGRYPAHAHLQADLRSLMLAQGDLAGVLASYHAELAKSPTDRRAHEALVRLALGQKRPDVAVAELTRWLALVPRDPLALHQLAAVLASEQHLELARAAYARLFASFPRALGPTSERAWRAEWLALGAPAGDHAAAVVANLQRLVALEPDQLALRRRLIDAYVAAGLTERAIAEQRELVARAGHERADEGRLIQWLVHDQQPVEALRQLKALDARRPLDASTLQEAANSAAHGQNWDLAAYFLGRTAHERPQDARAWEAFARAEELAGDPAAAVVAWQHRLALGAVDTATRSNLVGLLSRLHRSAEALALLEPLGERASLEEARETASLAHELKRPASEARALREVLTKAPGDLPAHLALADLLERQGDTAGAGVLYARALDLAPRDPDLLTTLAGRQFYAGHAAEAAPLIARLEGLPVLPARALRLLAEALATSDPAAAATYLDRLQALGQDDALTALRRGELAETAGDPVRARAAFERSLSLAGPEPRGADVAIARAAALEHLGRTDEALAANRELSRRFPERLAPWVALARHDLQGRQWAEADAHLARARAIAPAAYETRLLAADLLRATGREAEALPLLTALRRERPTALGLLAEEASVRHDLGQFRAARDLVRPALAGPSHEESLRELYRDLRDDGTSHVEPFAHFEHGTGFDRTASGVAAVARPNDHWRVSLAAARLGWAANVAPQDQADLGAEWRAGVWKAEGNLALANREGAGLQAPLGRGALAFTSGQLVASARAEEVRWDESNQAALANGRERKLAADVTWAPDSRVSLHGLAEAGQLSLDGQSAGPSNTLIAEASLKPSGASPWTLSYQYRHRSWGTAGPAVGLPDGTEVHVARVGYAHRAGPWHFELQPGYGLDARSGAGAPTVAATAAVELQPDAELALSGAWSGRSFDQGSAGSDQRVDLTGRWSF